MDPLIFSDNFSTCSTILTALLCTDELQILNLKELMLMQKTKVRRRLQAYVGSAKYVLAILLC